MATLSKFVCAAALIAAVGFAGSARAESGDFPPQFAIEARQIHATHRLNCRNYAAEETKLDAVVNFESGSDKLSKKAIASIAKAATLIKKHGSNVHILVEGHTDSKGNAARNQDLSYRRALRVVHTLVEKFGVKADVAVAKGFGSSKPVATNSTPAGRAANRRVDFVIVND